MEDTTLLPEEISLKMSGKAQSSEMVIAWEKKQSQEQRNEYLGKDQRNAVVGERWKPC